jgi:hypothetical protein
MSTPIEQSNLFGTQSLSTPYGPMAIDNSYPTDDTIRLLYDQRDRQRASEIYLWALPLTQFQVWKNEQERVYGAKGTDFVIYDSFNEKGGVTTGNATTPYIISLLDLSETGAIVVDFPAGKFAGGILDWWEHPTCDLGITGPDRGNGAKYLIVSPQDDPKQYEGSEYLVFQSPTNKILLGTRVLTPGAEALEAFKQSLKVYPLGSTPQPARFISGLDIPWAETPPVGLDYFKVLHQAIQNEPVADRDKAFMAYLTYFGIEDGKPFNPDDRLATLLAQGTNIGELLARANIIEPDFTKPYWEGTFWYRLIDFPIEQEDETRLYLDERSAWFYEAITTTKGMKTETPGVGQIYLSTKRDKDGQVLRGGETYRLTVLPNAPAEQFWAVTIYAQHSRIFVRTDQMNANLDSHNPQLQANADGSVDIYFGPNTAKIPTGLESNWIATNPDEGWFPYFRLYAPKQAFFDKSWGLGDIERVS